MKRHTIKTLLITIGLGCIILSLSVKSLSPGYPAADSTKKAVRDTPGKIRLITVDKLTGKPLGGAPKPAVIVKPKIKRVQKDT
jgi:hypothetical protein